mgnify:CR=1 FL=1
MEVRTSNDDMQYAVKRMRQWIPHSERLGEIIARIKVLLGWNEDDEEEPEGCWSGGGIIVLGNFCI